MKTRIPFDEDYTNLVGKAVYTFAYYEWTIIWIINSLEPGFVSEYSREKIMTSGVIQKRFRQAIDNLKSAPENVTIAELEKCQTQFEDLIPKRNALIHAHPFTDSNGSQILNYQTIPTRTPPDMKWKSSEIRDVINEIDELAKNAGLIFDKLRA